MSLATPYQPIDGFDEWRSLSVDDHIWQRQLRFLEERRAEDPERLERALAVAFRAAAVDSGAIEGLYDTDRGLTLTIAVQEAAWQTAMRAHDERMPDFFEAQLAAYDLASEIAASTRPVNEVWVRELHEVLCRPQGEYEVETPQGRVRVPLPKGEYKRQPNQVKLADGSIHAYAPVDLVPAEMHRLVGELNSSQFEVAHPVLQAGYAHYCLVAIHPFADGNGRVARAVASVFLRRTGLIPLLVWADERNEYFDALEATDQGGRQTFVDFVFDRAVDTFNLVTNQLGPRPEDVLAKLRELQVSYGGLTFRQLDEKAREIAGQIAAVAVNVWSELTPPPEFQMQNISGGSVWDVDDPAYRHLISGTSVGSVDLRSPPPAGAQVQPSFQVLVARDENARYAFRLETSQERVAPRDVRLIDVYPTLSDGFRRSIQAWTKNVVGEALADLLGAAEAARRDAGF